MNATNETPKGWDKIEAGKEEPTRAELYQLLSDARDELADLNQYEVDDGALIRRIDIALGVDFSDEDEAAA